MADPQTHLPVRPYPISEREELPWRAMLSIRLLAFVSMFLISMSAFGADENSAKKKGSRGLVWGWGHSWTPGWPGYAHTESDIAFFAFHPQMGWFVSKRLELYGEGSLLVYHQPKTAIAGGIVGSAGRWHFRVDRSFIPYFTLGAGLIWTSSDEVVEIDRTFNFQMIWGAGIRLRRREGPGVILEFRNHHISNAGTAGENLGINAATILIGLDWILG